MLTPQSTNTTTPSSQLERGATIDDVLAVSRLVWDHVVSPGWLDGPPDPRGWNSKPQNALARRYSDLFRAAEAMFPIVGLVCRRALAFDPRWGACIGSYSAIQTAASVPAPSCVAWILNSRHVRGKIDNDIGDLSIPSGCCCFRKDHVAVLQENVSRPDSRAVDAVAASNSTSSSGSVGGIDSQDHVGGGEDFVDVDVVVKEVSATVVGLLVGGHVGLATALIGGANHSEYKECQGTLPRLWDGRRVASWEISCHTEDCGSDDGPTVRRGGVSDHLMSGGVAGLREKVIVHVRDVYFGQSVCRAGGADGVRWLVDVIGVETKEASWLMYEPIRSCVCDGNMEVVKWLFERFGFGSTWPQTALSDLCYSCARGPRPCNALHILTNKHSTVEYCQWPWVQDFLLENGFTDILENVLNPEVAKWLLIAFPAHPDENALSCICKNTGDVELTQWLVTEHNFTPTAATFASACSTSRKKGSTLARWLSTRVSLSQSDIIKSLVSALSWGNIEVAEWLDETFHVMDAVKSDTEVAENCLVELCTEHKDRLVGLEWFLQHLSAPDHSGISMSCIHKAISQALNCRVNSVALLLETFPAVEPLLDQGQFKTIVIEFMQFHLEGFQHLCSGSRSAALTPEFIGQCLTSVSFHPFSSKVVKWIIRKFNLQYSQIKENHNQLLFRLLTRQKNRCAECLINTFDIPLSDVVDMAQLSKCGDSMDLTGWHMILDHYGPSIDGALIRKHLMPLVSRSPHLAIHTINSFGLTIDEFCEYVDAEFHSSYGSPEPVLRLWLGMPLV
ncbi:hypothetical protein Pelo_14349 [Pelomyxa schiedti]|nr:hypothetical protein Pelo_14349 [Pelomyxa schiedti]